MKLPYRAVVGLSSIAAAVSLTACAVMPEFIWYPYLQFHESSRFSFEYPKRWEKRPVSGGVELREARGRASIGIVFLKEGDPGYKPAEVYRKSMYDWGSTEDAHVVSQIIISSHTAYQVRFTTHKYDPQYIIGAKKDVIVTEVTMVPYSEGIFAIRYVAARKYFWNSTYRRYYMHFMQTLQLFEQRKSFKLK